MDGRDRPGHDGDGRCAAHGVLRPHLRASIGTALVKTSSCPALCRVSTSFRAASKDVDGRDRPGHDGDEAVGHYGVLRPHLRASIGTALVKTSSCPALCRVSTSLLASGKDVDGRDVGAKQRFVACPAMTVMRRCATHGVLRPHLRAGIGTALVKTSSCPALCRVSTFLLASGKNVDGRDLGAKQRFVASPGHDDRLRPAFHAGGMRACDVP